MKVAVLHRQVACQTTARIYIFYMCVFSNLIMLCACVTQSEFILLLSGGE